MKTNPSIFRSVLAVMLVVMLSSIWIPAAHTDATADRILPKSYFLPRQQQLKVEIQITVDMDIVSIEETIPLGWTIDKARNWTVNDRTILWGKTAFSGTLDDIKTFP